MLLFYCCCDHCTYIHFDWLFLFSQECLVDILTKRAMAMPFIIFSSLPFSRFLFSSFPSPFSTCDCDCRCIRYAAFEADRDGDNEFSTEEFAALWDKQDQLRRDLSKLNTALAASQTSYNDAAETTKAYLQDSSTRGGQDAMRKLILLLNDQWLCPQWEPGPCTLKGKEDKIVAAEKSYEVKYLMKVVADIAKIDPQPFNLITTVTTSTTSTETETYTFTSTTTETGTTATTTTVSSTTATSTTTTGTTTTTATETTSKEQNKK